MRNINDSAMTAINTQYGLESNLIVRVWWSDLSYDYSDKTDLTVGEFGRILEISGLDNVLGIDQSSTSSSVTVKLDDSDGQLKNIINNVDVHKIKVQILQWFTGWPITDAFVLFTGYINTPIEWSEGERSLTFTVLNLVENYEFGFSLEEGIIQQLPVNIYGKAFPVVFGNVLKVPALQISESPSGILAEGFAWLMDTVPTIGNPFNIPERKVYEKEIAQYQASITAAFNQAQALYQTGIAMEEQAAEYNDGDNDLTPPDDFSTYLSLHNAAQQYFAQSNQYMDEMRNLQHELSLLQADYEQKKAYAKTQVLIASQNFPRGVPVTVEIDDERFLVRFDGVVMTIIDRIKPINLRPLQRYVTQIYDRDVSQVYEATDADTKFKWFDAGSTIRVISVPLYYVACMNAGATINAVYARRKGVRVNVPTSAYEILDVPFTNSLGKTVVAKVIQMNQPLTTITDVVGQPLYDSDDVWCDITSDVPDQFVHIMFWTLALFTNITADPDTFNTISIQTVNTPMNFAVLDRVNTYDFIKQLCYLARTAVWIDDRTMKLRYLPANPTAVDTITPDDVVENTLSVTCVETESLVTKIVADWKMSLDQQNTNKFIARQNVAKYGLMEETINMFCYNTHEMVQRVALFWLIRKSTSWKKIKLKTFMNKLKLESHDPVLLSGFGTLFSNNDVVGIVESAVYDSSSNTIDMVIWLPIRWGEMDPYVFAYTAQVGELWGMPNVPDYLTGNPFYQVQDLTQFMPKVLGTFVSYGPGPPVPVGQPVDISDQPPTFTVNTAVDQGPINNNRPSGFEGANNNKVYKLKDPTPVVIQGPEPGIPDIGTVTQANDDGSYKVTLVDGNIVTATQITMAEGYKVAVNSPVVIVKKKGKWYMASPVWEPETNG